MPAVAATNPPVIIAMLAAATERIKVGSGGVMLPNHAPLVVAEQFALLEAAFPGRIDLGIGRAPGTDPLTRYVLRGSNAESADEAVSKFPDYVEDIRTLMTTDGVERQIGPRRQPLRATPAAPVADMWLLGSSDYPPAWPRRRVCPTSSRTTSPVRGRASRSTSTARPTGRPRNTRSRAPSSPSTPSSPRPRRRRVARRCPTCR